jgi:hypothetical protein
VQRKAFDSITIMVGALFTLTLVAAGALLMWGSDFANSNVHNQLAEQQITFPAAGSAALASSQIGPYLNQYAGQQLLTGQQAEAYADHFIAVHLSEVAGGKTYSQVSAEAQADPTSTVLAAQVDTLFKGTTLRGLLLEAYAFGQIGQIVLWASIAAFAAAAVMLVLVILGYVHWRRVSQTAVLGAHDASWPAVSSPMSAPMTPNRDPVPR